MRKTIWACWFQGREAAPPLVRKCLDSWERKNPEWEFRCLDARTVERFVPIRDLIDLDNRTITAASLSDIVRISLLHEFGGVWVDATLFCNRPLDDWLPDVMQEGFFAFADPVPTRPLSSWFLSAEPDNRLVAEWYRRTVEYWQGRDRSNDYFWFHHRFKAICETSGFFAGLWARVPKISAGPSHALQASNCIYRPAADVGDRIDWTVPVFKVTHRLAEPLHPDSVLARVLGPDAEMLPVSAPPTGPAAAPAAFASLKVATENLGDHVQILAGRQLLSRFGVAPRHEIDRDDEIMSAPCLDGVEGEVGILLNGWFKTNGAEWPPHPKLAPLIFGFHIRLFQCPELVSDAAIAFYRRHQPIGCRDSYTAQLLAGHGVETFVSHCLSLTLPRRVASDAQSEVFVVSRDARICDRLPPELGPCNFVSHYSGSNDFAANMREAESLLDLYRSRARLVVTTLLHCALPAIAMGIPVVMFYPLNSERGHASDRERFSSLTDFLPVHDLDAQAQNGWRDVDWNPAPVRIGDTKLAILDRFFEMAGKWNLPPVPPLGPIAPPDVLPVS